MTFNKNAVHFMQTARENGLLFGGSDAPAMIDQADSQRKSYLVRGALFEVPVHYEVLNVIGYGAYGVVCAAVDLRLVPSSAHYNSVVRTIEEDGAYVVRQTRNAQTLTYYRSHRVSIAPGNGVREVCVSDLYTEPFHRRVLARREPSPFVAIKRMGKLFHDLVDGRRMLREVKVLRYLHGHPNIVRLMEVGRPPTPAGGTAAATFSELYLVTELMDTDLSALLKSSQPINMDQIRFITYQLVKALVYVHSSGVIHRDLKPGNILLNGDCDMKLCDFGLARGGVPLAQAGGSSYKAEEGAADDEMEQLAQLCWSSTPPTSEKPTSRMNCRPSDAPLYTLTDYVVTRYYRAPELLVMSRYNHAVDMWAVGCILAEMVLRHPLFAGANYLSQLSLILETPGLRGVPQTPSQLAGLFKGGEEGKHFIGDILFLPQQRRSGEPDSVRAQVHSQALFHSSLFGQNPDVPVELGMLVAKLLSFDPQRRPTAVEALRDPFFRPLYHPHDEMRRGASADTAAESREVIADIDAYRKEHPCLVVDEAPPFNWAIDHRIISADSLRSHFQAECDVFADLQRQLLRQKPLAAASQQV